MKTWITHEMTEHLQEKQGHFLSCTLNVKSDSARLLFSQAIIHRFCLSYISDCSSTPATAIICKRVCLLMQNFCLTVLTFRVTFTPVTFCVSRDLKFSLNHNFKQLNSINDNLILKVK